MRPYQEEYIANCRKVRELSAIPVEEGGAFTDEIFDAFFTHLAEARRIMARNTKLLQEELLPVLDNLYQQEDGVLADMEAFADALTAGAKALDVPLASQIHIALLNIARLREDREAAIRELYKLGMARYAAWNTLIGLDLPEVTQYTGRMRYCFAEASSYLKYFDEFPEETKGYILRSLANMYLGNFVNWRDKLECVRHTMRVFTDPYYRASAPGLPWDAYMHKVHLQMTTTLPYYLEETLQPADVADVMESVHLIYEVQYAKARESGKVILAHTKLPYYGVEFACGLVSKEELLKHLEELMDDQDPTLGEENVNYQVMSVPAFYIQYLRRIPEAVEPRREYITQIYRRLLRHIEAMPQEKITDVVQLYIRQTMASFMELEEGVTYLELCLAVMRRFAPELYAHGHAVGRMSQAICHTILSEEPSFFDDIPEIAALPVEEKGAAVEDFAYRAGLLHDMGKLTFTALYSQVGRKRVRIEDDLLKLHTLVGGVRLRDHPSTAKYADVAMGHHRWYDGSNGYPEDYARKKVTCRALVDVVSLADFLDNDEDRSEIPGSPVTFEEKIATAMKLSGRCFSPLVTAWLYGHDGLSAELKELFAHGRREGYYHCFRRDPTQ